MVRDHKQSPSVTITNFWLKGFCVDCCRTFQLSSDDFLRRQPRLLRTCMLHIVSFVEKLTGMLACFAFLSLGLAVWAANRCPATGPRIINSLFGVNQYSSPEAWQAGSSSKEIRKRCPPGSTTKKRGKQNLRKIFRYVYKVCQAKKH